MRGICPLPLVVLQDYTRRGVN